MLLHTDGNTMPIVRFTPHLRMHLACPDLTVEGADVRAVLEGAFRAEPRLRSYVLDDQGALRQHVTIFVNQELLRDRRRQTDRVAADDEVFIFQALSGG
jgi:sulfur carrier protein ThiS